jgi:hypothetical protein
LFIGLYKVILPNEKITELLYQIKNFVLGNCRCLGGVYFASIVDDGDAEEQRTTNRVTLVQTAGINKKYLLLNSFPLKEILVDLG